MKNNPQKIFVIGIIISLAIILAILLIPNLSNDSSPLPEDKVDRALVEENKVAQRKALRKSADKTSAVSPKEMTRISEEHSRAILHLRIAKSVEPDKVITVDEAINIIQEKAPDLKVLKGKLPEVHAPNTIYVYDSDKEGNIEVVYGMPGQGILPATFPG